MQKPARMQMLCQLREHRGPINEAMDFCQIDTLEICFNTCGAAYLDSYHSHCSRQMYAPKRQQNNALFGAQCIA